LENMIGIIRKENSQNYITLCFEILNLFGTRKQITIILKIIKDFKRYCIKELEWLKNSLIIL